VKTPEPGPTPPSRGRIADRAAAVVRDRGKLGTVSAPESRAVSAWRTLLGEVARVERAGFAPLRALRAAIAIAAVLAIGLGLHDTAAAASMGAGALLAGVSSLLAGPRPAKTMAAVTVAMALATFVGSATGSIPALHLAILVPWAFAAGLAGVLGSEASTIGIQSAMAMIVFGRFAEPVPGALELAAYVAAGGVAQTLLALLTSAAGGMATQRRLVAGALEALAGQAATPVPGGSGPGGRPADAQAASRSGSPLTSAGALDAARAYLASPALFASSAARPLSALVIEGERIRLELAALQSLRGQLERYNADNEAKQIDAMLRAAATSLGAIAASLRRGRMLGAAAALVRGGAMAPGPDDEPKPWPRPDPSTSGGGTSSGGGARSLLTPALRAAVSSRAAALAGQIRAATRLAADANGARATSPDWPRRGNRSSAWRDRARDTWELLVSNLHFETPQFRHAVRLAVVLPLCELIADVTPLKRGYWIALTAGVVLRPDYRATMHRGVTRALGTVLGVGIASLLVLTHPGTAAEATLVVVLAWVAFAVFQASYTLFSSSLTALVVVLLGLVTTDTLGTAGDRLIDTLIGGAIALLAYRLWPTWSAEDARERLTRLMEAQRAYAAAVLAAATSADSINRSSLQERARRARRERANAEEAVGRSLADPVAHRIDPAVSSGVLAAMRRFVFAAHSLRAEIESGQLDRPMPELAPLARALDEAASSIASALGEPGTTPTLPPLRSLHDALAGAVEGRGGAGATLAATDEMVDALDTAASVIGERPAAATGTPGRR
jgi:hypothetical protein